MFPAFTVTIYRPIQLTKCTRVYMYNIHASERVYLMRSVQISMNIIAEQAGGTRAHTQTTPSVVTASP